ncbi:hypothetical protein OF83DRAFT_1072391, partial [Amylostereum chailletii]
LSLFCVACPQPGVNLKPDWKSYPETLDSRCKYTASVVLDGNYSAQHLSSATPAQREVRLGHGTGYFVPEARYLVHLRHAVETKATRVKCANHHAISQAESEHKGCDVSGVVSIACGDHGAWFPLGTVNLQKGEKQMNVDYALCSTFKHNVKGINRVLALYDIMCKYGIHLRQRVDGSKYLEFPLFLPTIHLLSPRDKLVYRRSRPRPIVGHV